MTEEVEARRIREMHERITRSSHAYNEPLAPTPESILEDLESIARRVDAYKGADTIPQISIETMYRDIRELKVRVQNLELLHMGER